MSRQDDSPRSITPAIIHVCFSSEPLTPETQPEVHQEIQDVRKRRQYYVDEIRRQARLIIESDDLN